MSKPIFLPDTTPVQPTIDPATATAVIANVCGGLRPFLSRGREILKRDRPETFKAAVAAVAEYIKHKKR